MSAFCCSAIRGANGVRRPGKGGGVMPLLSTRKGSRVGLYRIQVAMLQTMASFGSRGPMCSSISLPSSFVGRLTLI